jgi:hypothetical protein
MVAEDPYWEEEIYRGPTGNFGTTLFTGVVKIYCPSASTGLLLSGVDNAVMAFAGSTIGLAALQFIQGTVAQGAVGVDFGQQIVSDSTNGDIVTVSRNNVALRFSVSTNSVAAASQLVITSSGVTALTALSVKGATPAVTAGQTDLGNTTTATVITTAGGIALPALANTFWKVNINGVALGIPCFAL